MLCLIFLIMLIKNNKIPFLHLIFIGLLPSFLKKIIYRIKGYNLGKDVKFGFGSAIIGKKVEIGNYSRIGICSVLKAQNITLGRHVNIGNMSFIVTNNIIIGEDIAYVILLM